MNMSFYVGALGANNCTKKLSVISNNLANVNTAGYKPKAAAFSELINYNLNDSPEALTDLRAGAGMQVISTNTHFGQSGFTETGGEYDYAIANPHAFFMVQDPATGEVSYTRDGHFYRGEMGDGYYLITKSGKMVLDQFEQPMAVEVPTAEDYQAQEEDVNYEDLVQEEDPNRPRVGVYTFANPSHLLNIGDNEFVPSDAATQPVLTEEKALVRYSLEASGTDVAKEFSRLIETQRAFSYALRMVTVSDEIVGTINTLRG